MSRQENLFYRDLTMHLQLAKLCCAVYTTEYILFLFFLLKGFLSLDKVIFSVYFENADFVDEKIHTLITCIACFK